MLTSMKTFDEFYTKVTFDCGFSDKAMIALENFVAKMEPLDIVKNSDVILCLPFGHNYLKPAYESIHITPEIVEQEMAKHKKVAEAFLSDRYHNEIHRQGIRECMSVIEQTAQILNSDTYLYTKALEQLELDVRNAEETIVLEGAELELTPEQVLETTLALTQKQYNLEAFRLFAGPDNEGVEEGLIKLERLQNRYDRTVAQLIVLENDKNGNGKIDEHEVVSHTKGQAKKAVTKASDAVDKGTNKASRAISKGSRELKTATAGAARGAGRIKNLLSGTFDKLNRMNKEERLEAVLQGGMRKKLSSVIRAAIIYGGASAFGPGVAAIALLTRVATRKRSDQKLKHEMRLEFQSELKMVKEKIRDAESAGDKERKYELMRIENHLEQSLDRLDNPISSNKNRKIGGR